MSGTPSVVVVGSANMDLVVRVPRLPGPGETVTGGDLFRNPGGKGANQAVAAARLGQRVAFVGCVGDDDPGRALSDALRGDRIDTTHLAALDGVPTGTALIAVAEDGENLIVVSPGANARVSTEHVEGARAALEEATVTLVQLEIPLEAVGAAARAAAGTVVLNPAPARDVPREILEVVDVLVPNRVELGQLTGGAAPATAAEATEAARALDGPRAIAVTLGSDGVVVVDGDASTHVPGVRIDAVDTTAAGDAFCGALADALARGEGLEDAARWAVRAAAVACTRVGAQGAMPTRDEVEALDAGSGGAGVRDAGTIGP